MTVNLVTRTGKGDSLTFAEMDSNLTIISQALNALMDAGYINTTQAQALFSDAISNLAKVTKTGSYLDLTDTPSIPANVSDLNNDLDFQTMSDVTEAIRQVVGNAPDALNTLEEIDAQIAENEGSAAALAALVNNKANIDLSNVETLPANVIAQLKGDKGDTGEAGAKGDKGDTGQAGQAGSDASVTAQSIATALGYTPANKAGETFTGDVSATKLSDSIGNVRSIPQNSKTAAYTLIASDAGKCINITTGGVTVPSGVFSAGDVVTIYNNSASSQTITQDVGLTLQWAGQSASTTGNRALGLYGIATALFVSPTVAVISGAGLS
jgi:hypothetical protein